MEKMGQKMASFGETEAEKEGVVKSTEAQEFSVEGWDRLVKYSQDLCYMQYGEVSPDHPAYEYVRGIAETLPGAEKLGIKVRIIPNKFIANAFALPDGTIALTSHLFEFAEYYEAVAGAVAHEKIHIEKAHSRKEKEKEAGSENKALDLKDYFEKGLKKLGTKRLGEYESDLRGALKDLEQANINPLGFKILLQKFAQREYEWDDVHGSSMDRALNIATGTYLMDLKSLSGDLTKIPEDLVASLKEVPPPEFAAIFSRPKAFPGIFKPYEKRVQERHDAIKRLQKPDHILLALSAVGHYTKDAKNYDPDDDACLAELAEKAQKEFASVWGTEDKVAVSLLLSYFSGIDPQRLEACLKGNEKTTPAQLVETLEKAATSKVFHYSLSSSEFGTQLIHYLQKHNLLKKEDTQMLQSLDAAYEKLQSAYSVSTKTTSEQGTIVKAAEDVFRMRVPNKKAKKQLVAEFATFWTDQKKEEVDSKIIESFEQNFSLEAENVDVLYKSIERTAKHISESLNEHSLDALTRTLSQSLKLFRAYNLFLTLKVDKADGLRFDSLMQIMERYLLIRIFSMSSRKMNLPKKGEEQEFAARRLFFYKEWGIDNLNKDAKEFYNSYGTDDGPELRDEMREWGHSVSIDEEADHVEDILNEIEREEKQEEMNERRRADDGSVNIYHDIAALSLEENRAIDSIEQQASRFTSGEKYFLEKPDSKNLEVVYRVCVDSEYQKSHGLDQISRIYSSPGARGKAFFAHMFDLYVKDMQPEALVEFLNENESKMPHMIPILKSYRTILANISDKISLACETGALWDFPLRDALLLSDFVSNPFVRGEILNRSFSKHWNTLSFEEKIELLFPEKGKRGIVDFSLRERFLCEEVRTKEQFQRIKQSVERSIDDFFSSTSTATGGAILADRFTFKYSSPMEFLRSALTTSTGDNKLREWISSLLTSVGSSLRDFEEDNGDVPDTSDWVVLMTEKTIQQLYSLDEFGRRAFVRKLLVEDEAGLLRTEEHRRNFFSSVFDHMILEAKGQEDLQKVLQNIKESLAKEPSWELLYFAIQGILADKLFIPPAKEKSLKEESKSKHSRGRIRQNEDEYKVLVAEQKMRTALQGTSTSKPRTQSIPPVEFIKETAGNLGALGRRFLQVLPQFIELSADYEREFSDVYDKVAGQSKFAALATVEREWPDVWNEYSEIGERIGGGSILTVFHAITKEGRDEVLKVRNPNILYHLNEAEKIATSVSERLAKEHGGAYAQAKSILPDIHSWVSNDVAFEGFLEKDKQFREKYQGFSVPNNPYRIRMPESFGPSNQYFSREEYVPGINLTSIDSIIASDKNNAKQAIGLLCKFYMQQVMDGRMHSDIHPGNYAITETRELVMYDRNYYIDLSNAEKEAVLSLFNPFVGEDQKIEQLRSILHVPGDTVPLLRHFAQALSQSDIDSAKKDLIQIKASGGTVPLNITLLLKNISSLQSLARKVGYSSVFEAVIS